jgi:hypothetical protein
MATRLGVFDFARIVTRAFNSGSWGRDSDRVA